MAYIEFVEGGKHAPKDSDIMDSPDHFKDAGYLIQENEIIIDIDEPKFDRATFDKMIKMFGIETETVFTDRGVHLYFEYKGRILKKNYTCALGFDVEVKNHKNLAVTVKRDGVLRETINKGKRQPWPKYLKPPTNKKQEYDKLVGLADGDGRNNKLWEHCNKIQGLQDKNVVVRFINECVFDEPLSETEFQAATRDRDVSDGGPTEYVIATELMDQHKIVKFGNQLYHRSEGRYVSKLEHLERLTYNYCGEVKTHFVNEVISQFEKRCRYMDDEEGQHFPVQFKNGVLKDGKFYPIEYQDFTPHYVAHHYDPEAAPVEIVDYFLDHLSSGDGVYRDLICEIMGHCLITDPSVKAALAIIPILVGDGRNGKGTFLKVLRKIFGPSNISTLSVQQMNREQYLYSMKGKLINLGDDLENRPFNYEQLKVIKNVSSADSIELRELFKHSMSTVLTSTLIFTSNHLVKTFDKDYSVKRRIKWLPVYQKPERNVPHF